MFPPSFRHRSGPLALAAAMLITACGAADDQALTEQGRDPYAVAQDLIALDQEGVSGTASGGVSGGASGGVSGTASGGVPGAASADQIPAAIAATDCTRTVVVDEYGFEDETITCPDDETSGAEQAPITAAAAGPSVAELDQLDGFLPIDLYDAVMALVPDPALSARFQEIGRYLALVEAACGVDQDRWHEAMTAYTAAAQPLSVSLADQVVQSGETGLDGFIGSLEAKVVARAVVERAVMGSGCANPDAEPVPRSAVDEASLALTAAATAATVTIDNTLRASTYGPLFHLYSTLPNYQWMRSEVSAIDMVLLGTSQLGAGVDVAALNAGLATEVGSAWIPGALAEVQQHWVDEVIDYTDAATLVWFIGPLDLFVECDVTVRGAEFQQLADARAAAFLAGGFVAQASPIERILGPAERSVTVRGDAEKRPGLDVEGLSAHREQYGPAFAEGWFCDQRAAIVADTISRLEDRGRDVLVVGMPVHPELRSIRPADRPPLGEVLTPYVPPGSFIDLSGRMDDAALWSDMTHLTAEGAAIYTDLVAAELAGRGY